MPNPRLDLGPLSKALSKELRKVPVNQWCGAVTSDLPSRPCRTENIVQEAEEAAQPSRPEASRQPAPKAEKGGGEELGLGNCAASEWFSMGNTSN